MAEISIFVGTVYGNAQNVAEQAEEKLVELGHEVQLFSEPTIEDFKQAKSVLVVTSTTGQGDFPPNLEFFAEDLKQQFPLMEGREFAVVALGDSSYGDTFAAAGRNMFELLTELQGKPKTDLKVIDAMETFEPEEEALPWIEEHFS
ncbi:MAG: flavodoxin [Aestuariibacter sp.]